MSEENTSIEQVTPQWATEQTYAFAKLMSYYKCAMMEVETKLNVLNEEFSLQFDRQPISAIKTRMKKVTSIHDKLIKNGFPVTVKSMEENLHDIAGVRVVCSFVDDVYMLADALLNQDDIQLITRKDYIAHPKENGYRSLHLIVAVPIYLQQEKRIMRVEIQLRTISMDSWASLEHQLRYKKTVEFDKDMERELKTCAELSAILDSKMDALRGQVYNNAPGEVSKEELARILRTNGFFSRHFADDN